jgi:hypothetical protein
MFRRTIATALGAFAMFWAVSSGAQPQDPDPASLGPVAPVAPLPAPPVAAPEELAVSPVETLTMVTPMQTPAWAEPPRNLSATERERMRVRCEHREAGCDPVALLGSLERTALDRALLARSLTVDPAPWGKTLGKIHVVNHNVFGPRDALRFFNWFHVRTREHVIEREVVLRPGEVWDQAKVDESARRLRDPVFSVVAFIVPVASADPGKVDLLVVTKDVLSLRFNSDYRYQNGKFTFLTFSLSENNFLGLRKLAAVVYEMDLGTVGIGPLYIDKNVGGKKLDLRIRGQVLSNRDALLRNGDFVREGSESSIAFSRPLWTLDSDWGMGVDWTHRYAIERAFRESGLRTYDAPETSENDAIPWQYRQRRYGISVGAVRAFGKRVENRVKFGYAVESQRPSLTGEFSASEAARESFVRNVLPRSEFSSLLYTSYEFFTPRFREVRNVASFDVAEDVRLGPSADAQVAVALEGLGSDRNFARFSLGARYALAVGADGFLFASATSGARLEGGDLIDNSGTAVLRVVTPSFRLARVVSEVRLASLWNDAQNRYYTLGGDNGLRGYGINEFEGLRRLVTQTELRTSSVPVWLTKCGLVAFYEAGGAAASLRSMKLFSDLGFGLRILIPQLSSELLRLDLAFPLGRDGAGPMRITAGFRSEF